MSLTITERPAINNNNDNRGCNLLLRHPGHKDETDNEISLARFEEIDQCKWFMGSFEFLFCQLFENVKRKKKHQQQPTKISLL